MSLADEGKTHLDALAAANRAFMRAYPGERAARQPVHTVYGGAHLFKADTTRGSASWRCAASTTYAPRCRRRSRRGVGLSPATHARRRLIWPRVYERVRAKLEREPVEDFRIDFEDGFGARPDAEEDAVAEAAGARGGARACASGRLPPFIGIRIKSFGEEWKPRGARTLEHLPRHAARRRPAAACPTTSW